MTQQELKQQYSRQNWQTWLGDIFGSKVQFETQAENIEIDRDKIKFAKRFASVKLVDGKNLAVLDIETTEGVQIARNRVGLRELVVKLIDHARYHGILAFYHSASAAEYRLSFISSEPTIDADGNYSVQSTAPKRYTYVLGENAKTKTPADRLKIIADKHGNISLEDIKNAFSVETLTKEFYSELSNWYFWALQNVTFPDDSDKQKLLKIEKEKQDEEEKTLTELRNSTSVIRLITRLMFVWFLKQKKLICDELFDRQELEKMLDYKDKTGSTYYKAILQNLFFATLNTEMGDKRKFVNRQSGIQGFFRYERFFNNKEKFIELTKNIPFLNGGLFENLDKNVGETNETRIDCFSNRIDKEQLLKVPDFLFFSEEKQVDLNTIYDTKGKAYKVRGLIDILKTYNFTIEENTTTDIEVALDPELLGKVFENLLASFNPETQTTARKQTGSFYTPREIVDYMVNESLKAYICHNFDSHKIQQDEQDFIIDYLFNNSENKNLDNHKNLVEIVVQTLQIAKILDPACGSGAFPMGVLQKMVQILQKLDPKNELWKQRQLDIAGKIEDVQAREVTIENIEEAFENNELDYGRKLFLIESSIFGVDIQPIAVQISKLRFFISLICEQIPNAEKPNLGIRPLPNLETKFVAANTLIGLDKHAQRNLGADLIEPLEKELAEVRHKYFSARKPETKRKYRDRDNELRLDIANKLKEIGFANATADKIAAWNPYDQSTHAEWFDPEWMFGLTKENDPLKPANSGGYFDVVLGNPPYGADIDDFIKVFEKLYPKTSHGFKDIYKYFFDKSLSLLKQNGILCFITPNTFLRQPRYADLRRLLLEYSILELIDLGEHIFEAVVPTAISLISLCKYENVLFADLTKFDDVKFALQNIDFSVIEKNLYLQSSNNIFVGNVRIKQENEVLLDEILDFKDAGINYQRVNVGLSDKGNSDLSKRLLYESKKENESDVEFWKGTDINSYFIETQTNRFVRTNIKLNENERVILNEKYFRIAPKLIWRQTAQFPILTIDYQGIWFGRSIQAGIIKEKFKHKVSYEYLCGLLNSKYLHYLYEQNVKEKGRVFPQVKLEKLKPLPIIIPDNQQPIITLVEQILQSKKQNVDTTALETEIDKLVYKLYGLTEEEIGIIEKK
jgi:hypothetical protein